MDKVLEQLAEEERLLENHHVFSAIQGSLQTVIEDLKPPRLSKAEYDIAKGEIGHAYILVGAVEHIENRKLPYIRQMLDHYKRQLYKPKK